MISNNQIKGIKQKNMQPIKQYATRGPYILLPAGVENVKARVASVTDQPKKFKRHLTPLWNLYESQLLQQKSDQ